MKKVFAILLSLAITLSTAAPAFAAGEKSECTTITIADHCIDLNGKDVEDLTDAELKEIVIEIGLTSEEADELIAAKNALPESVSMASVVSPMSTPSNTFPRNPSIGDTFVQVFYIPRAYLVSAASCVSLISELGAPVAVATIAAAMAVAYADTHLDSRAKGVIFLIEYIYGADNDGEIRWNYRDMWYRYYY